MNNSEKNLLGNKFSYNELKELAKTYEFIRINGYGEVDYIKYRNKPIYDGKRIIDYINLEYIHLPTFLNNMDFRNGFTDITDTKTVVEAYRNSNYEILKKIK